MTPLLLLLLPTLALANMKVTITGDFDFDGTKKTVNVEVSGENKAVVTDPERDSFQLSDNGLKNCVRMHHGARPTDAYVHVGTPWGDLYHRFGWREVIRTMKPVSATVMDITTTKHLSVYRAYVNHRDTPTRSKVTIERSYENRITSSWTKGGQFTVGAEVSIGVGVGIADVGGSTNFEVSRMWGEGFEESKATTISDGAEVEFEVPPNSRVYAKAEVSTSVVKVKVDYEASLYGDTAVNYHRKYKGHHFFGLDINNVMRDCGLPLTVTSTEYINLDLITGVKIEVMDAPPSFSKYKSSLPIQEIEV